MSPGSQSSPKPSTPLGGAGRACQFCRFRKIKCDSEKPSCGSCRSHNRECIYVVDPPKQRPSKALINAARQESRVFEDILIKLKKADGQERTKILDAISLHHDTLRLSDSLSTTQNGANVEQGSRRRRRSSLDEEEENVSSDEEPDVTNFLSRDEGGKVGIHGPSSFLNAGSPVDSKDSSSLRPTAEPDRYQLIANAALQRQREHDLRKVPNIYGIPSELAMHLLDLHWNRQHHTYLLTYRPAFMRDLLHGGPYCSEFLLNAVLACSSKFSERREIRADPDRPETAGEPFFQRCAELLAQKLVLESSSIPTITGLIMLGSTFIARGLISKGWLYTGYALRMVYDLGLHLDSKAVTGNAEDIEIRRRVFWGAFICDKLQSLYLGRPSTIPLREANVSRDFMDTFEEMELFSPYIDPKAPGYQSLLAQTTPTRLYSVSTFQHLCSLSKIMTSIMDRFYVVGATAKGTRSYLDTIDERLVVWYRNLPSGLRFEPWLQDSGVPPTVAAPNIIILLTTYNALVILLHRPFISNGHLRSTNTPSRSWERCVTAARNITSLALGYQSAYSLRRANYMLSYAVYVACTIHARNPAIRESTKRGDTSSPLTVSLRCLDELAVPNCGVSAPAKIIRRLMEANGIPVATESDSDARQPFPLGVDMDLQLFSSDPQNPEEVLQDGSMTDFAVSTQDLDLLFGFMNEPYATPAPTLNGLDGYGNGGGFG